MHDMDVSYFSLEHSEFRSCKERRVYIQVRTALFPRANVQLYASMKIAEYTLSILEIFSPLKDESHMSIFLPCANLISYQADVLSSIMIGIVRGFPQSFHVVSK
jgi:hypothetical protein